MKRDFLTRLLANRSAFIACIGICALVLSLGLMACASLSRRPVPTSVPTLTVIPTPTPTPIPPEQIAKDIVERYLHAVSSWDIASVLTISGDEGFSYAVSLAQVFLQHKASVKFPIDIAWVECRAKGCLVGFAFIGIHPQYGELQFLATALIADGKLRWITWE